MCLIKLKGLLMRKKGTAMQIKFPLLNAEEIEIRVNRIIKCYAENAQGERVEYYKADLLLYKDARVDMYYLDRYVGADSWQRTHRAEGNDFICFNSFLYLVALAVWVGETIVTVPVFNHKSFNDTLFFVVFNF